MASNLVVSQPKTADLPPWIESLERSKGRVENGKIILRAGTQFPQSWRDELTARAQSLRLLISSATTEEEAAQQIRRLWSVFPASDTEDMAQDGLTLEFASVMSRFPGWAVRTAIDFWMRREHSEGGENYAFKPSPPQLARLCRVALAPVQQEFGRLDALSRATVDEPDNVDRRPAVNPNLITEFPKDGPAVRSRAEKNKPSDDWGILNPDEVKRQEEARAAKREQMIRANAEARRRDFEAAGKKVPDDPLAASPALRKVLAEQARVRP